jgi:flavin-dependent dehydrogenase
VLSGPHSLAEYERRWRKALEKEIVVGYYTRKLCARLSDGQIEGLFHLARTDGIVPIIRERADFEWHSGLIFALLQRLSFMRPFRPRKTGSSRGTKACPSRPARDAGPETRNQETRA